MNYMTDHKTQLEEEKKRLMTELALLGKRDAATGEWEAKPEAFDQNEIDDNQQASRFEDYEERTALIEPLETQLQDVEKALQAIENGTYGKCTVCGAQIEEARLSANPSAATCMAHME